MIKVKPPQEPLNFNVDVKVPGLDFLRSNPVPTNAAWKKNRHWMHVHQALYDSLGGICSYCACFTPRKDDGSGIDHTSIDHFLPKSKYKELAYEWSNYRLCRTRLNSRKGDFDDVTDPYVIGDGLYSLNFSNFFVVPDPNASDLERQAALMTIDRLCLNEDEAYVDERARVVFSYVEGLMKMDILLKYYPFIAMEMALQDFDKNYLPLFKLASQKKSVKDALARQS